MGQKISVTAMFDSPHFFLAFFWNHTGLLYFSSSLQHSVRVGSLYDTRSVFLAEQA